MSIAARISKLLNAVGPVIAPAADPDSENRWQRLATPGWIAIVALTLGLFVASLPARYATLTHPSANIRADLAAYHLSLSFYASVIIALDVIVVLGFLAAAIVVTLLTHGAPRALFVSLTLTTFGAGLPGTVFAITIGRPISDVPFSLLQGLGWFFLLRFAYLFPSGRFTPWWTRFLIPLWAVWVCLFFTLGPVAFSGRPLLVGLAFLIWVGWFGTGAYAQYHRYLRVDTAIERYQTRWAVLGFFGAIAGALIATLPHIVALSLGRFDLIGVRYQLIATAVICLSCLLIPLTLIAALLRRRLFDVDVIIHRTLVYSALSATLALVYGICIIVVVGLGAVISGHFSIDAAQHPLTLVTATLVVAALAQPLRRRIQRDINRRFYRRRFHMQRILEAFGAELKHEIELEQLGEHLVQIVSGAMQPSHISLWLTAPDSDKTIRARARFDALNKRLDESN